MRTKVKGIFAKNEESKTGSEPLEGPVEEDGSPVPDMLRLEGQEEPEEDNFDEKGQQQFGQDLHAMGMAQEKKVEPVS